MADATPSSPTTQTTSHVSAARPFPPLLVPAALLLATAVGLLSLLPSLAQTVWELPHLFVLGLVISYGVFTQRNTDVERNGDGNGTRVGALAWNARYRPDEPLIVVADHDGAREGAMERPLSLPVRRLKPPPATQGSCTDGASDGGIGEDVSSAGFCAGARTAPSPPSVLDADLGLSPCSSQPQSPPFFANSSAATKSGGGLSSGYYDHQCTPRDDADGTLSEEDDGEATDWDEEEEPADGSEDGMTVSSERSVRGDFVAACANDLHNDGDEDTSVDEELFKLASKAAPAETGEEVDRKADEFIAKFREQIRMQRL